MRKRWIETYQAILLPALAVILVVAFWRLFLRGWGVYLQKNAACLWGFVDAVTQTAGIKAVITATGAVCFALTYVNTARERRVKGILMEQVIREFYPWYGWIFSAHFLCAILGQYGCAVEARATAVLCLLGMFLSVAYALEMALSVVFSRERREDLVSCYIERAAKGALKNGPDQARILHQVGQYVGERFQEGTLPEDGIKTEEAGIVGLLLDLGGRGYCSSTLPEGDLLDQFALLFRTTEGDKPPRPEYLLYDLPCCQKPWTAFQNHVLTFSRMWYSVLDGLQDGFRRAELACRILREAERKRLTAPVCCGLIVYLHEANSLDTAGFPALEDQILCARFLGRLSHVQGSQEPGEQASAERSDWCRDLLVVYFCLLLLEGANFCEKLIDNALYNIVRDLLGQCDGKGSGIFWNQEVLKIYLCYGYAIYRVLAVNTLPLPSRGEMAYAVAEITKVVRVWLS